MKMAFCLLILGLSYCILLLGYTVGTESIGLSYKTAKSAEANQIKAVTTVMTCGKLAAVVISKGDGSQVILSPVLPSIANALYERVGAGFAMTIEVPCGASV